MREQSGLEPWQLTADPAQFSDEQYLPVPYVRQAVSRRSVLKAIGGGTLIGISLPRGLLGVAGLSQRGLAGAPPAQLLDELRRALRSDGLGRDAVEALPSLQRVWRPEDLMLAYLQYLNLELDSAKSPPVLVAKDATRASYLVVNFQGQHVLEQALPSSSVSGGQTSQTGPPGGLLSGPTRLVFQFQGKGFRVPFTFDALFSWLSDYFTPSLSPFADQPPAEGPYPSPPPSAPAGEQTAIEAPWQLIVTPDSSGGWEHSLTPVTHGGWTELWHTRLGVVTTKKGKKAVVEPPSATPNLRAIWTPGYGIDLPPPADPFTPTALTAQDRFDLVYNMTTYLTGGPPDGFIAAPAKVSLFHLSALGANTDVIGDWPAATTGLISWLQRSAQGRDSYVRVEQAGYLFPTGHKASLITVTDRQFVYNSSSGEVEAYLVNTAFVVVRDPLKNYAADPFKQQDVARGLPFRQITLTTLVTPPVNTTSGPGLAGFSYPPTNIGDAFWVTEASSGAYVAFNIKAVDWAGQTITFQMPLAFISAATTGSTVNAYDPSRPPSTPGDSYDIAHGYATDRARGGQPERPAADLRRAGFGQFEHEAHHEAVHLRCGPAGRLGDRGPTHRGRPARLVPAVVRRPDRG